MSIRSVSPAHMPTSAETPKRCSCCAVGPPPPWPGVLKFAARDCTLNFFSGFTRNSYLAGTYLVSSEAKVCTT